MKYRDRKRQEVGAKLNTLSDKYVVGVSENYRGLSYSNIVAMWQRWLMSDNPDHHPYGDILFLRGSVGYHRSNSTYLHSCIDIPQGIAVLVPIVTTHFNMGEEYEGISISDEFYLKKAVREHIDAAGPFWATLEMGYSRPKVVKLVQNLESFRVETSLFDLNISEKNPFLDKMDGPNFPGKHIALVGGYFVLLHNLPPLSYKIRFGGYGMNGFYTESLYDINIRHKAISLRDVSGPNFTPQHLLLEEKNAVEVNYFLHI
jgi:hypothetical protein